MLVVFQEKRDPHALCACHRERPSPVMYTDSRLFLGRMMGPYHVEELIEQRAIGPLFLVRQQATGTAFLLRLIAVDAARSPAEQVGFLASVQPIARQLQTLRHPYLMPILDAGHYNGLPFLVYPHVPVRTLHTRIEQAGPLDPATAGRYLDQLAAALEYAHEHGIVHGALSADSCYLQLDGRLVVGDVGVYSILAKDRADDLKNLAYRLADSAAPEQWQGQPAQIATDVYAMGAILYRMLTGSPVYSGRSSADIARQSQYAPVPSLTARRPDLPRGLDDIVAQALAKQPEQRQHRPGVLANAFQRVVSPRNTSRTPFLEAPAQPIALPFAPKLSRPITAQTGHTEVGAIADPPSYPAATLTPPPPPASLAPLGIPYPPPARLNRIRLAIGALLALVIATSGTLAIISRLASATNAQGSVVFVDAQGGHSNGVNIAANNLTTPPAGAHYQAWLIDDITEQILPLGALAAHGKTYGLTYQGQGNLLEAGNHIEITQERTQGTAPLGGIILSGTFPPKTFIHIRHLMSSFPSTPGKVGLLVGLRAQVQLLDTQAQQLQATGTTNPALTHCLMLNMLDILEGKQGMHYQPLPVMCQANHLPSGDGFGILPSTATSEYSTEGGYLADASDHATLAIQQPDVTPAIRTHAQRVVTLLGNMKGWLTALDGDLLAAGPPSAAQIANIATSANEAYDGVNGSPNGGTPTSAPPKGGVLAAYLEGQMMGTLPLVAASH
jgi:serine/threonine protein kinase